LFQGPFHLDTFDQNNVISHSLAYFSVVFMTSFLNQGSLMARDINAISSLLQMVDLGSELST
jgi:hypothetical protein